MVKKITVNCDFSGAAHSVNFYIGDAAVAKNPISFQSQWLSQERGGSVPEKLMESLDKIKRISDEHNIPFEDLYDHVVKEMENGKTLMDIEVAHRKKIEKVSEVEKNRIKSIREGDQDPQNQEIKIKITEDE